MVTNYKVQVTAKGHLWPMEGLMGVKSAGNYAVGLIMIIDGMFRLINNGGRPSGKWKAIVGPIYDVTGNTGFAILTIGMGAVFLIIGFFAEKENER